MVLLHQDIYTILNVVLNYNTKWQSRMLIWTMKENMIMKFIYISSIRKSLISRKVGIVNLKRKLIRMFILMVLQIINLLQTVLVIILHPYMLTPLII